MPTFFTDSGSFRNLQITGSTIMSASSGTVLQIIGSGSTLFSISGSSGELFRISDSGSSTTLFSVSSGSTTILDIDSSKNVRISGSSIITGSLVVNGGSGVELQVASTGVTLGNEVTDNHNVTGSLNISGSTTLRGNTLITGSLTTSGSIRALPGSVTAPSYAFVGSTNYGMFLNGTTLSLVNNGTSLINIDTNKQVILPNTWAAVNGAHLLAVGHAAFPMRANASATNYYPAVSIVPDGATTAGGLGWVFDNTATYGGLVFTAGNATTVRPIPRVVLRLTNLVNTNDTESADFSIASKTAGIPSSSLVERFRITSAGSTLISGSLNISGSVVATLGTMSDGTSGITITGTNPTTLTSIFNAINIIITSSGTSAFANRAASILLSSGYTGAQTTQAFVAANQAAGTGTNIYSQRNIANNGNCSSTTTGTNIGNLGIASNGNINVGNGGYANVAKNSGTNIGVYGTAFNNGTSPTQVGGYFGLNENIMPSLTSAALICDNSSSVDPIFIARDNGNPVFTIQDGGSVVITGSLTFAAPTSPAFNGEIVRFGAGTLTTGQLYFLSSSGTWSLANANSTSSSIGMLGIAVGSSPTANGLLIRGFAASSSYTYGTGSVVYMQTGSGIMTANAPTASNHVVRVMGYQTTLANTIYFDPDKTWVTLA